MTFLLVVLAIWGVSALLMYLYSFIMVFANVVRNDEPYRMLYVYPQVFLFKIMVAALPDTLPALAYYFFGPVGLIMAINENRLDALKEELRADIIHEFNEVISSPPDGDDEDEWIMLN